jgi:hypothetical protein
MPLSLVFACVWALLACFAGMGPQRFMWPAAWALIVTGIPLLGWVTYQAGPVFGLVFFVAGASVLRWPLIRAGRKIRRAVAADEDAGQ